METASEFDWQTVMVWGAVILAVVYLVKMLVINPWRKGKACDSCGAYKAVMNRPNVKTVNLSPEEAQSMREELAKKQNSRASVTSD